VTPGYVPPPEFTELPPSTGGRLTETTIDSRVMAVTCRAVVYTPPGYGRTREYPLAVFLDLRAKQTARVLDWLIAHDRIAPIVAVFIGPKSRGDAGCSTGTGMTTFVNSELLTWMSLRYDVTSNSAKRAVLGVSYAGKDVLDVVFSPVAAIDAAGLLIPGRRLTRAHITEIASRRDRDPHVAILAGQYDRANLPTARDLRDALLNARHRVDYIEVPEGHSAVTWSNNLRLVLDRLFPDETQE
jgi:enterochelin esterase-like enzyme